MKIFYSSFFTAVIAIFSYNASAQVQPLTFTAIMDMSTPAGGSSGKAVMLTANQSIADLSEFSIQSCYNGNSTPGSSSNPYFTKHYQLFQ